MKKVVYALLVSTAFISGSEGMNAQSSVKNRLQKSALKQGGGGISPDDWIRKIQQQQDAIVASWKDKDDDGGSDGASQDCVQIPTAKPTECVPESSTTAAPTTELPTPSQETTQECIPTVAPTTELPTPSQETTQECIPTVAPTTELPTPSQETTQECIPTVAPTTELPTPSQETTQECIPTVAPTTELPTPSQETTKAQDCVPSVAPTTELPTPSQETTKAQDCVPVIPTVAPTTELPTPSQETTKSQDCYPTVAPTTELPTPSQETTKSQDCYPTVAPTTELPTPSQQTTEVPAATTTAAEDCVKPTPVPETTAVPPSQQTTKAAEDCVYPSPSPPEDCTEENTPNIYINEEEDCVWQYNTDKDDFECVKMKCKWSFNATDCSWDCEEICVAPDNGGEVVPPSEQPEKDKDGKCKVKCEDYEALEFKVKVIQSALNISDSDIAGNGNALDEISDQIDQLVEQIANMQAIVNKNAADIEELQGSSGSGSSEDAVQATLSSIQENGVFFGDRWWMGQQMDNLYAIDLQEQTYYTFEAGKNATL